MGGIIAECSYTHNKAPYVRLSVIWFASFMAGQLLLVLLFDIFVCYRTWRFANSKVPLIDADIKQAIKVFKEVGPDQYNLV